MQKILYTALVLLCFSSLCAQSVDLNVVASSGGYNAGNSAMLSWTLGESIIATGQTAESSITQGFQQPIHIRPSSDNPVPPNPSEIDYEFAVFPNPTNESINITKEHDLLLTVELYNVLGQRFRKYPLYKQHSTLNLSHLAAGTYFLRMYDHNGIYVETFKITKMN